MFEVMYSINEQSMCYVDHPKFLKYLKDKYEKNEKGRPNGFKLNVTPYMKANKNGTMQEIAWNLLLPSVDVKSLEKIAKQEEFKSPRDIELEEKAAREKEALKLAKKQEREAIRVAKKAEEKARKQAERAAKKAEKNKGKDDQLSLGI